MARKPFNKQSRQKKKAPSATPSEKDLIDFVVAAEHAEHGKIRAFVRRFGTKDMDKPAHHGRTALTWAASNGNRETAELLLNLGANIDAVDGSDGEPALSKAAYMGDIQMMTLLLDRGADLEVRDKQGATPLMHACSQTRGADVMEKETAAAELMLNRGADAKACRNDGRTPLHCAGLNGNAEVIALLLAAGAEPNAVTDKNITRLMLAATSQDAGCVKQLLAAGADVNAKSDLGKTALHCSAPFSPEDVVRALVDAGADIEEKNADGHTALALYREKDNPGAMAVLAAAETALAERRAADKEANAEQAANDCRSGVSYPFTARGPLKFRYAPS